MDRLILRAIEDAGETYASLESSTLEYLLKVNESLDIKQYVEKKFHQLEEAKQRSLNNF